MFNSLKQLVMSVGLERETLQAVLPESSTPNSCDAGNHDDIKIQHDSFDPRESLEKRKREMDGSNTGKKVTEKKSRRHVCQLCFKNFTQSGALKTHMLTHTGDKPFVCVLCGKAFSLACNLKRHELLHTGEKPFLCDICSKAFTRASHLKGHKRIHTGERPYKCPYCEADFSLSHHLQKHVKKVHTGNSHSVSEVAFPTFDDLERHKRVHSGEKPYVGIDSGETSAGSSHPQSQSLIYTGVPAVSVRSDFVQSRHGAQPNQRVNDSYEDNGELDEACDRESYGDWKPGLNRHSEEHPLSTAVTSSQTAVRTMEGWTGEGVGKPRQNPERTREELLYSFMKRKPANFMSPPVPKDDEIIYCEECDQESLGDCPVHSHFQKARNIASSATASSSLERSDRPSPRKSLLSQDRSHVCQRCSAAFVMFNSLKLHMMFIHREKVQPVLAVPSLPDSCDVDDHDNNMTVEHDSFDNRESVEKKKEEEIDRNDTNERCKKRKTYRQTCDICFKSFTDLRTHKLTHSGYKQFACSMCSKSFTHACNLKAHELTHTGQKPFVCDACGKAFSRDSHLKAHKRIHTGERPYKCPHCDADFNQSNHVQKHIRTVHVGSRRFVCKACGGTFSRTTDLYKHTRVHLRARRAGQSCNPENRTLVHTGEGFDRRDPLSPDEDS